MRAFIFLILCGSCSAYSQGNSPALVITELRRNFYVYTTYNDYAGQPYPSNSMYVVSESGVIMIDTPWDTTQMVPLLDTIYRRHRKKVIFCISTHFHDDRTGGLSILKSKGIPTWSSKRTRDLCIQQKANVPEYAFSSDTSFQFGDIRFQTIYPGEGHTKDNIVVWFGKEKVLYGGCFIKSTESSSPGNLSHANVKAWPASLRYLMKKVGLPEFVIPGHQDWTDNRSIEHTLKVVEEYNKLH